jgi:hypothetical protein
MKPVAARTLSPAIANDCERQRVKVQVDHTGACPKELKRATPKEPKAKERKAKTQSRVTV